MELTDFEVNEAWVIFKVNGHPIVTEEGNVNIYAIIDAASTFILGNLFELEGSDNVSEIKIFDELEKCWNAKKEWPQIVYLEGNEEICRNIGQILAVKGINIEYASRKDIEPIIEEICEAFMENFG